MEEQYRIEWGDYSGQHEHFVKGKEELIEFVLKLREDLRDVRPAVSIAKAPFKGPYLSLDLTQNMTQVGYETSLDPPYYVSLGDPNLKGEVTDYRYFSFNTAVNYGKEELVPWDTAFAVLKEFVETGKRSNIIEWKVL